MSEVALQDTDTRRRLEVEIEHLGQLLGEAPGEPAEVREIERILRREAPAPRRSLWQSLRVSGHRLLLLCVGSFRFVLDSLLGLLSLVFLAIWVLQLPHPPKWDTWALVKVIQEIGNPVLKQIDAILEWPLAVPFYPFLLVFLLSVGRVVIDSRLARIQRELGKRDPRSTAKRHGYNAITWRHEQDAHKYH